MVTRELGQIPISIGSSLAIEGLLGVHPDTKNKIPFKKIQSVWVNVVTVVRNYIEAFKTEDQSAITERVALEDIIDEFNHFYDTLNNHQIKFIPYCRPTDAFKKQFSKANLRTPNTEKQKAYAALEKKIVERVLNYAREKQLNILEVNEPPINVETVAILTHHAPDLLWRFKFHHLYLLESHTGRLKTPDQWNGKLTGISEGDRIPFIDLMLVFFGDSSIIKGEDTKLKKEIKQIAETRKWLPITTVAKVRQDIKFFGSITLNERMQRIL